MAIKRGGRTLTAREQAEEVRRLTGWTRQEYQKQYDVLRNRVRAYERGTGVTAEDKRINVADLLASNAKRMFFAKYYGEEYKPTALYKAVMQAPSISSGKKLSSKAEARIEQAAETRIEDQFGGFIKNSKFADDIKKEIKELRESGNYTPQEHLKIIEKYLKELDNQRKNIEEYNAKLDDPFKRIYFKS